MKKFKFTIQGNKYDVNIITVEENIAEIEVNGATYKVELDKVIAQSKTPKLVRSVAVPSTDIAPSQQKTSAPTSPKGAGFVKSPLPGVILNIHVKEGDQIKVGTKLITLEAMKMENDLKAPASGTIEKIYVNEGSVVEKGVLLFSII